MPKVLVCGDVLTPSSLSLLHARVSALHGSAHGPFDAVLCTGLCPSLLLTPEPSVFPFPVPLHFVLASGAAASASAPLPAPASLASLALNATYHGPCSVADVCGLRVAFVEASAPGAAGTAGAGAGASAFTASLAASPACVDALLSNAWPAGVLAGMPLALTQALPQAVAQLTFHGNDAVAAAAMACAPRYHFCGSQPLFFQRAPYINPPRPASAAPPPPTRMISLAAVEEAAAVAAPVPAAAEAAAAAEPAEALSEEAAAAAAAAAAATAAAAAAAKKWIHALNLAPAATLSPAVLAQAPAGSTLWPYTATLQAAAPASLKRGREEGSSSSSSSAPSSGLHPERAAALLRAEAPGSSASASGPAQPPPPCWFCLASPHVEKHLVVSIGEEAYLALPRGGISPRHVLIVPTEHTPSLAAAAPPLRAEVHRFLAALAASNAALGMGTVAFERVLQRSGGGGGGGGSDIPVHTQVQVLGVPSAAAGGAAELFVAEGKYKGIEFAELQAGETLEGVLAGSSSSSSGPSVQEYLYVEVFEGGSAAAGEAAPAPRRLLHRVPPGTRHPLQFGREVLCRLLNAPDKIQWKTCVGGTALETEQAAAFRASFAPNDFTLTL